MISKAEALKKIEQGGDNFQVYTAEEHATFLKNFRSTEEFKGELDVRIKELEQKYDDDLFHITGKRRGEGERAYDFMKKEYSALVKTNEEARKKAEELEKAIADKSGDKALELAKSELESMRKKHQQAMDDWKAKYESMQKEGEAMRVTNEMDRSLTGLKFKDAGIIPEDVRAAVIGSVKSDLLRTASFVDGKLVFLDAEGKIMRDANLNVLTAKDILADRLKSILDQGRKQEGLKIEEVTDEKGKKVINLTLPDTVKTNADLSAYLAECGLRNGTPDYVAAYAKFIEKVKKVT